VKKRRKRRDVWFAPWVAEGPGAQPARKPKGKGKGPKPKLVFRGGRWIWTGAADKDLEG
jgi:hypothetical protein